MDRKVIFTDFAPLLANCCFLVAFIFLVFGISFALSPGNDENHNPDQQMMLTGKILLCIGSGMCFYTFYCIPLIVGCCLKSFESMTRDRNNVAQNVESLVAQNVVVVDETLSEKILEPQDLQPAEENVADKDCVVCYAGKKEIMFVPCNHLCICTLCKDKFQNLSRCPMCNNNFEKLVRVYS